MGYGAVEVERTLSGEAPVVHHLVVVKLRFYIVVADGDRYVVFAFASGHHGLAVLRNGHSVDVERNPLGGYVGAGIADIAAHGE